MPKRPSLPEYFRVIEAAVGLVLAWLLVRFVPFRHVIRLASLERPKLAPSLSVGAMSEIQQAISRASVRLPLNTACFQEGLTAYWMLRRRGYDCLLHYGLSRSGGPLSAHVWTSVAGRIVTGAERADEYQSVATFPAEDEKQPG